MELSWSADDGPAYLRVLGLGSPPGDLARLVVVPCDFLALVPLQPMAGRFERVGEEIRFHPRFPLVPGTTYVLLWDGAPVAHATVPVPTVTPVTRVVAIYPTAREVPLNLLKLYLQFSQPMSEGWAARAVTVRRADDGRLLAGVFLPMEPELWDHARQRLTLLLDPGRIKRGLAPHEEAGYPLEEGVPVVVTVDPRFRDAEGRPLRSEAERRYQVGPASRRHVEPTQWELLSPVAGSRDPLTVRLDRPLDRALLEHSLAVVSPSGQVAPGSATVANGEQAWSFVPRQPWRAEPYKLSVDARLEDLAGNSLARVFDRDLTRPEDTPTDVKQAAVPFQPRP